MAHLQGNRLLSQPCDVVWAGWRSTTVDLQNAGWQIAVEDSYHNYSTRLCLQHRDLRLRGITTPTPLEDFVRSDRYGGRGYRPAFHVQWMSSDLRVQIMESSFDFREIDAKPQFTAEHSNRADAFSFFAVPMARTEEIIVAPQDVSTMLDQIRKMQAPEMAAIRQREQRRDRAGEVEPGSREVFHAQILSFAA